MYLVVYGHSIQYCIDSRMDFFNNPVFKIIYSFHMPLFMIISGYLFNKSINRSSEHFLYRRFMKIIIPAISWYTIYNFLYAIINMIRGKVYIHKNIIIHILCLQSQFWFIFILFYLYCIFYFIRNKGSNKIIYYVITFVIILLLPDWFNMKYLKFMYPYFLIGYFYDKYSHMFFKYRKIINILSILIFSILLLGWKKEYYIYITGMSLYNGNLLRMVIIIGYRYIIGLLGSISFIVIGKRLFKLGKYKMITKVGKNTLNIYILQTYIMFLINKISIKIENFYFYNFIYTPFLSIVIIYICIIFIEIAKKNKITNSILIGGSFFDIYNL